MSTGSSLPSGARCGTSDALARDARRSLPAGPADATGRSRSRRPDDGAFAGVLPLGPVECRRRRWRGQLGRPRTAIAGEARGEEGEDDQRDHGATRLSPLRSQDHGQRRSARLAECRAESHEHPASDEGIGSTARASISRAGLAPIRRSRRTIAITVPTPMPATASAVPMRSATRERTSDGRFRCADPSAHPQRRAGPFGGRRSRARPRRGAPARPIRCGHRSGLRSPRPTTTPRTTGAACRGSTSPRNR